ncbi:MAG: helix-turn-helix domain-containing protein [Candidatus Rokubacteria bacterium]|nr:helix-turn-helix domain-containing protein [Candidatus Rokubacteria bacterium]
MIVTGARGTVPRRYLTRSEVARLFEVSPATVARWTREGKLPFVLTLGGQRRYARNQVIELIRRTRERPLRPAVPSHAGMIRAVPKGGPYE